MLGGKKKQPKRSTGYTIIEVMIVLAVSGVMFVIAANFISGKQEKASFTQGTTDLTSQIQDVVGQVNDGQFSDIPLNCTFAPNGGGIGVGVTTISNSAQVGHGQNSGCTFLGKLMTFPTPAATNSYRTISLAGGLVDGTNGNPTIQNPPLPGGIFVDPVAISGTNTLTITQNIPQNLQVKRVRVTDATTGATSTIGHNFGFLEGLGSTDGGSFQDGAQTISLVYSSVNMSGVATADTAINGKLATAKSVVMCVTDGTQYAQILIGGTSGNASQLSIDREVVAVC